MIDMALIKCSECGKKVSDTATECPHCGIELQTTNESTSFKEIKQKYNIGIFDYILIGLFILLLLLLVMEGVGLIPLCLIYVFWYLAIKLKEEYKIIPIFAAILTILLLVVLLKNFSLYNAIVLIYTTLIIINKKGKKINLYDIAIIMLLILAIIIRWPSVLESFSLISHGLYQGIAFIVGIISCVIINMLNKFGYKSIILHVLIVILCVISTITFGGFGDSIYILVIYLFTMCKLKTQSE